MNEKEFSSQHLEDHRASGPVETGTDIPVT
jgi:hypothetical protein